MLELPHVLVGAAIATVVPNPLISIPLSLASHFLGDYVPHWNPHFPTELKKYGRLTPATFVILMADSAIAVFVGLAIGQALYPDFPTGLLTFNLLACCLASVLPDVVEIPHYFFGFKSRFLTRLSRFQSRHQFNVPALPGILSQILVILLSLLIIFR